MYDPCDGELPRDEGSVRRIQRTAEVLHQHVLAWASGVIAVLPKRLPLTTDDRELLTLFLAQQRRLNLELDGRDGQEGLLVYIARCLPLLSDCPDAVTIRAAHKLACAYIEHAIEDAVDRSWGQHGLSPTSDAVINWRVSIRYMAQQLHRIACRISFRRDYNDASPLRFELTLMARELAGDVALKRIQLLDSVETAASL